MEWKIVVYFFSFFEHDANFNFVYLLLFDRNFPLAFHHVLISNLVLYVKGVSSSV